MLVTPWAFKVAAVVIMMKSAMILEIPMPTSVSSCMRASCRGAWSPRFDQGLRFRVLLLVFDFFGRLPEEQVRD